MAPKQYKLTYFNAMGRAENTRILFAMAGVDFDDTRISKEEWSELKSKTDLGHLPLLETAGVTIAMYKPIESYVAKKFGFAGDSELDYAKCLMIIDFCEEMMKPLMKSFSEHDDMRKSAMRRDYGEKYIHEYLPKLNKICSKTGYFVGKKVSWPDVSLYVYLNTTLAKFGVLADLHNREVNLKNYPNLRAMIQNVKADERISEWEARRPITPF